MDGNSYQNYSDPADATLNHLMDSVHQSRIEGIDTGQHAFGICIEDVHVVNGAIEIRARMVPELNIHSETNHDSDYLNPIPNYKQLGYASPYQLPNQFAYQYPLPYQSQYTNFNQAFPTQYSPQFGYHYPYPGQFPAQYFYQYPMASLAGSIIGAISRFALMANWLRR